MRHDRAVRRPRPAARILLVDRHGCVLMFRFTPQDRPPLWCTPGGAVDPGESYAAAARRELWEEVGLDIDCGPEVAQRTVDFRTFEGTDVTADERYFRVDVDTIERIDAAGDYMCIYTADNSLILRETMKDLEKRLDPRYFQRVHRSTIVNLSQVREVKPHTNGECFLVLGSGAQVKVSRSYRDVVARFVH